MMSFFNKKLIYCLLIITIIPISYNVNLFFNKSDIVLAENVKQESDNNSLILTDDPILYQRGLEIFNEAFETAKKIEVPYDKNQSLLKIIDSLSQIGEMEKALEISSEIKDNQILIDSLSLIAKGYINKGEYDQALAIIKQGIASRQEKPDIYTDSDQVVLVDLVKILLKDGKLDQALEVSNLISLDIRKASALNAIVSELIAQGNSTQAKVILDQTLTITESISNDEYAYEANGSCDNLKFQVLSEIGANLRQLALIDQARKVALEVTGCGGASSGLLYTFQSDAFLALIKDIDQVNILQEIWQDSQQISSNYEKLYVWKGLALKFIQLNKIDLAFNVAQKISTEINSVTSISDDYDTVHFDDKENSLTEIAVELTKVEREDLALKLIEKIKHPLKPQAKDLGIIAIAEVLKSQGKDEKATSILDQYLQFPKIPEINGDRENYADLFNSHSPLTQVSTALVKIGEMERVLTNVTQNKTESQEILNGVVFGLIELGKLAQAWALVETKKIQGEAVRDLALKSLENKPKDLIFPLKIAQYLTDPTLQQEILIKIIPNLNDSAKLEEILQSFSIDESANLPLARIIASQWVKLGKTDVILGKIATENDLNLQLNLIIQVIPLLTKSEEIEKIESILKNVETGEDYYLKNNYFDAVNLLSLKWLELGQFDRALNLISLIKMSAQKIMIMENMIPSLNKVEELEKILQLLELFKNNDGEIDEWQQNSFIDQVAIKMIKIGSIDQAIKTKELINDYSAKIDLLLNLGLTLMTNTNL